MDKLGEGTYGVVYMARGTPFLTQTSKLTKSSPSKKSDSKANKKASPPPPSDKSPFLKNSITSMSSISEKSSTPTANLSLFLSTSSMTWKNIWEISARKLVWTPWLLRYNACYNCRASVTSCCRVSIIVMRKRCFIGILSPKTYWFPKTTFSKLQILGLPELQAFQSRDTLTKSSPYGTAHPTCS